MFEIENQPGALQIILALQSNDIIYSLSQDPFSFDVLHNEIMSQGKIYMHLLLKF